MLFSGAEADWTKNPILVPDGEFVVLQIFNDGLSGGHKLLGNFTGTQALYEVFLLQKGLAFVGSIPVKLNGINKIAWRTAKYG